jgi:arsenate reductase-like glutaredoxin family protein
MGEYADQYEQIRKAIRSNIAAIRNLLDQADNLYTIAQDVSDEPTKKKLSDSVQALYKSIDELIKQTDNLFDQYKYLAVAQRGEPISVS